MKDLSCLRGKHIFVDSMNDKFKDIWCRVLTFAGCRVFQALPPVTRKGILKSVASDMKSIMVFSQF